MDSIGYETDYEDELNGSEKSHVNLVVNEISVEKSISSLVINSTVPSIKHVDSTVLGTGVANIANCNINDDNNNTISSDSVELNLYEKSTVNLLEQDVSVQQSTLLVVNNCDAPLSEQDDLMIAVTGKAKINNYNENRNCNINNNTIKSNITIMNENELLIFNLLQELIVDSKSGFLILHNLDKFQCLLPMEEKSKDLNSQLDYLDKIIGVFHHTHFGRIYDRKKSGNSFGTINNNNYDYIQEKIHDTFFDNEGLFIKKIEQYFNDGDVNCTIIDFSNEPDQKKIIENVMNDDNKKESPNKSVDKRPRGRPKKT